MEELVDPGEWCADLNALPDASERQPAQGLQSNSGVVHVFGEPLQQPLAGSSVAGQPEANVLTAGLPTTQGESGQQQGLPYLELPLLGARNSGGDSRPALGVAGSNLGTPPRESQDFSLPGPAGPNWQGVGALTGGAAPRIPPLPGGMMGPHMPVQRPAMQQLGSGYYERGAWHREEGQGQEGWKRPRLSSAVQAERASMWDARQVLQRRLQVELQKMAVQEAREARVHALILDLERLRTREKPLSENIHQVVEIVQDINSVRSDQDGPHTYIIRQFAQRVKRNVQKGVRLHWLKKPDLTGQLSAMEHAILFADGEASSGTVRISLTPGSFRNQVLSLQDICALSSDRFTQFYLECMKEIKNLLPMAEQARTQQERDQLLTHIATVISELVCAEYLFFVANPTFYRCSEHWDLTDQSEPDMEGKMAAMQRAAAKAVEVGMDLELNWSNWDDRCAHVSPLERRSLQLRQQISAEVAQLAGGRAEAPTVQYSVLMHLVEDLKWNLDEASVVHSTAISTGVLCMLTPLQVASITAAGYPHLVDLHYLYGRGLIPRPPQQPCKVEELHEQPPLDS